MGDRTWVEIDVRAIDWEWIVWSFFERDAIEADNSLGADEEEENDGMVTLAAYECDGGYWNELEELLRSNFCEFDKRWGHGNGYMGGKAYCRNINGEMRFIEILEDDSQLADFLREVKDCLPITIKILVKERYAHLFPEF